MRGSRVRSTVPGDPLKPVGERHDLGLEPQCSISSRVKRSTGWPRDASTTLRVYSHVPGEVAAKGAVHVSRSAPVKGHWFLPTGGHETFSWPSSTVGSAPARNPAATVVTERESAGPGESNTGSVDTDVSDHPQGVASSKSVTATTSPRDSVRTWRHDRYRTHPMVPGPSAGRGTGNTALPQQIRRIDVRVTPGPDAPPTGRPHGRDRFRMGRVEVAEDDRMVSTADQHPRTVLPAGAGRALRGGPRSGRQPRRVMDDIPGARRAQPPGVRREGGRHRARPGRRRPMTALTIAAAVILVAAGAIIQFRTAAVTTESAGGGADADAFQSPVTPPADQEDPMAARAPSSAGPVAPFQVRPAAVQVDSPEDNQPASTSGLSARPDQGTPVTPAPMSPAAAAPTDTATEPTARPSADQPAPPSVVEAAQAPPREPTAPAPAAAAQPPPPQAHAPDPAPAPQPTTAPPPSPTTAPAPDPAPAPQPTTTAPPPPTTAPEAAPPRGKSADHRPEHANGGVGNTDRPKPSHPGSGPKD
jgi:hypothetical protein